VELGEEDRSASSPTCATDSTPVPDALDEVRAHIGKEYGKDFLPDEPTVFKTKSSAQDAHEAIRPTSLAWTPEKVKSYLERDMLRLYKLIWDRFVACQMLPAVYDQTTADIAAGPCTFRATAPAQVRRLPRGVRRDDRGRGERPRAPTPRTSAAEQEFRRWRRARAAAEDGCSRQALHPAPPRFTEAGLEGARGERQSRPST
jgi:DNA topoisomerase IA